jgi:hypothetical protein
MVRVRVSSTTGRPDGDIGWRRPAGAARPLEARAWTFRSIIIDGDYDDIGPDGTLGPSESLDSDEVRNDDGDIVVDAPLRWIPPEDNLTLDKRLAAEEPEVGYTEGPPRPPGRHRRQISGSPNDGPSFYTVAREEFDQDEDAD